LRAQDPAAQQDAEAAREKLLKAEDELDNIQANSEVTKTSVDGMKSDVAALQATVTKLQSDNAALRQQVTDLQTALDEFKAEQIKARQTLIDNVAGMIAAEKSPGATKTRKKKETPEAESSPDTSASERSPAAPPIPSNLAPPPDDSQPATGTSESASSVAPPKPQKGYYHIVAGGETLTLICEAYRENGVKVTVAEIRKANGLTAGSTLKPGQKLFIPKPGI
jgi:chromosome segregation ATPase